MSEIPTPKKKSAPPQIFTPAEISAIFAAADSEILPALAIAAFAGLRLAEVARLDWCEVKLAEKVIVIEAAKSKTAARRLVSITDNLEEWLIPRARPFGPVNPCQGDVMGNAL